MCFGTFDLLHLGHLNYFQQARRYGDYLIVVVARDKTKQDQKKETMFSEEERLEMIKSLKIVDEATLGYPNNHLKIILEKKPDVLCLGYDHEVQEEELQKKLAQLGLHPAIYRMKAYQPTKYKSSKLKGALLKSP